jgi:hypothetical protein
MRTNTDDIRRGGHTDRYGSKMSFQAAVAFEEARETREMNELDKINMLRNP